jgi:hypothetical protein
MPDAPQDKLVLHKHFPDFGLPNWSNNWLNILMDEGKFPPAVSLGRTIKAWWLSDIQKFLANLPRAGETLPVRWPQRPKAPLRNIPDAVRWGRPPGGKVVTDPGTGQRRYVMPPKRQLITRLTRRDPPDDTDPLARAAE